MATDLTTGSSSEHRLPANAIIGSKSHGDYTIGWICALSKELTAAKAVLDQIHPNLPRPPNDANRYVLGSIGGHNIVIACLPEGITGTNHAAMVATRMIGTFQAIKGGFMVGIGGGIPSKVRLGDVVVSSPTGQYPGVVQWDFCRAETGGKYLRTGALNKPPIALLTALANLRTEHDLHGNNIQRYLDEAEQRYPNLNSAYVRPDPSEDPLFWAGSYRPIWGSWGLELTLFWRIVSAGIGYLLRWWAIRPTARRIDMGLRNRRETNTAAAQKKASGSKVHYGLIASGNQVIKDAKFRDNLNKSLGGNVLCFEMEAAGLMDDFPCIVIRGICDYADSRKNDVWQEYAAGVAAAYAKDFLMHLEPLEIQQELPIKDIMLYQLQVHESVTKIQSLLEVEEDLKILEWLAPIEYNSKHNDLSEKRQSGTGRWLLHTNKYQHWLQGRNRILFCPGMPGAGKTFLTSAVVDHLFWLYSSSPAIGVAYFYCNFKRKDDQTIYNILVSLLKQLARRHYSLPGLVKETYRRHKLNNTRPSKDEIFDALQFTVAMFSRVFIVVDALDECQSSTLLLSTLFRLHSECGMNIFATSRHIQDIADQFTLHDSTVLEILAHDEDLRNYLDAQIDQSNRSLLHRNREAIKNKIIEVVDGMFLLAQLHFQSLENQTSPKELKDALEGLATGELAYKAAYDEAMERIHSQPPNFRRLADKVLSWIICAKRPLTKRELQHALAVESKADHTELDAENFPEVNDMISACAGLVTIDEESNIFRLIHYTTQEYFDQNWKKWFPDAQEYLAITCITYLSYDIFKTGYSLSLHSFKAKLHLNPLFDYAAQNWGHHARECSNDTTNSAVWALLNNEAAISASSQPIIAHLNGTFKRLNLLSPTGMAGLHIAAYFGLLDQVERLLQHGAARETQDNYYGRTPLSWAAAFGNAAVVQLLLRQGADWEAQDTDSGLTPLSLAAMNQHVAVMELLIRKGADKENRDKSLRQTPLSWAAERGHTKVVELLLREGAEPDARDADRGRTPLSLAAKFGKTAVVELLLHGGADLEARDTRTSRTPLLWAAKFGRTTAVELLLQKGAHREARDYSDRTPLLWAAKKEYTAIVELLVHGGAELEPKDDDGRTPLSLTAGMGQLPAVELLLSKGADRETKDTYGQTPLSRAAENGHITVVETLLREGADLETRNKINRSPLSYAARNGHAAVVDLLFREGADPEVMDTYYHQTPLSAAAEMGHTSVIALLLEKGVELETGDDIGQTPLSLAARAGFKAVVELLLQAGANRESKDFSGRTPLWWAVEKDHVEVAKLLSTNPYKCGRKWCI
ncbi:hypothetical protein TWF696_009628 [Orbilia brochopaga]|uniref:Nucleoside phosphorylase domain-containing protein n=1 Tax=Orbilia brochopaga TaxID=3140254 RepID=A0AAV9UB59_9PEZI